MPASKSGRQTKKRQTKKHEAQKRPARGAKKKYWSADVTRKSDALDLQSDVFAERNPSDIARSLKQSAEHSKRRKSSPFRSAMSMLTFYINRAGKNLSGSRRRTLDRAKQELRKAFGREP